MRAQLARTSLNEIEIREGLEDLSPARIATLYRRAPLLRRVKSHAQLWTVYQNSSIVLSAWHDGYFVGIARVLSDGAINSYLCDIAVEPDVQGLGVGSKLVEAVMKACKGTALQIRADISAQFLTRAGFERVENAWVWKG